MRTLLTAIAAFVLVACGQAAAPSEADAQTSSAVTTGDVTTAERTAVLAALQLRAKVMEWNGSEYAPANREVGDSALGGARYVP